MILGIYGAGGLGRELLDLAHVINTETKKWERVVFINDFKSELFVSGVEVFTFAEFERAFTPDKTKIAIATGEPRVRQILRVKSLENGYALQSLIHPRAFIGTNAQIEDGVIIQFGCFVSCDVMVATNTLIQSYATIGHDCIIGRDAVISTFVAISGACRIGERSFLGVSVPIRENISVGDDSIVGIGSIVLRDIPSNVVAMGNPARAIKENTEGYVFRKE